MTALLISVVAVCVVIILLVIVKKEIQHLIRQRKSKKAKEWKKHVEPLVKELSCMPEGCLVSIVIEGYHAFNEIEWLRIQITELGIIKKVVRERMYNGDVDFRKLCRQEMKDRTGRTWMTLESRDDDLRIKSFFEEVFDEYSLSRDAFIIWNEAFRTYEVK